MMLNRRTFLVLFLGAIFTPSTTSLGLKAVCKVSSSLARAFHIGGIYLALFPTRICDIVRPSDFQFQVFPYYKASLNAPYERITPDDSDERLLSYFDPLLPTAIYSHGFFEGERSASIRAFRAAYLRREDYNFIAVDWHNLAPGPWYPTAVRNVLPVGLELARLIDRLVYLGAIRIETLHLIGFSLGAHVMAIASNRLTSGRVPRITGLDPAYPGFIDMPLKNRLDKSDANFVDVIHTTGGVYGYPTSIGHVDFYPNGGRLVQPGCAIIISFGTCDHWRAWRLYEESVRGGEFIATECNSWSDFVQGRCSENRVTLMGINVDQSISHLASQAYVREVQKIWSDLVALNCFQSSRRFLLKDKLGGSILHILNHTPCFEPYPRTVHLLSFQ